MTPTEFRNIRKASWLTQLEMARLLGVSVSAVRQWEQARRSIPGPVEVIMTMIFFEGLPTLNHLEAVAKYIETDQVENG